MSDAGRLSGEEFRALMDELAAAWNAGDADRAAARFAEDAVYVEPTGKKFHRGRDVLRDLFARTSRRAPMHITWRHVFFDEPTQTGAAEFDFSWGGHSLTGVTVVTLENGFVFRWREYQAETDDPIEPVAG